MTSRNSLYNAPAKKVSLVIVFFSLTGNLLPCRWMSVTLQCNYTNLLPYICKRKHWPTQAINNCRSSSKDGQDADHGMGRPPKGPPHTCLHYSGYTQLQPTTPGNEITIISWQWSPMRMQVKIQINQAPCLSNELNTFQRLQGDPPLRGNTTTKNSQL